VLSTDLLTYYRTISHQTLTIVDLETTGSRSFHNRVIEISVLKANLEQGILQHQTSLINPQVTVPEKITEFTGISQDMVDNAPLAEPVWKSFWPILETGILTAHNIAFDYPFIQSELSRLGIDFDRPKSKQFCTVLLSRILLPDLPSRSLPNLVRYFGFQVSTSHRAEADTLACWLLAERLLNEIANESDEVLLARFREEWLPLSMASHILGCSQANAQQLLERSGAELRKSKRSGSLMYRRRAIEDIFWQSHRLSSPEVD
jgi:DNA polymerase III subunit epsilon